ncbi:hypothetical protein GCM10027517_20860 [Phycicoccus ginsengisoli]
MEGLVRLFPAQQRCDMSANASPNSGPTPLPDWALGQAMNNLDAEDSRGRDERARALVHDFEDERHDDDDPDQGGEA